MFIIKNTRYIYFLLICLVATLHATNAARRLRRQPSGNTVENHQLNEREAQITDFRIAPTDDLGVFKYAYKTSNGIDVQAAGSPLETIGIYSYVAPDGTLIEVRYIADELGFHVVGRHLPRPPPIPDYILRSLEYIRTHTEDGKLKSE